MRTIRETWGADSGTNVIRRETFYRDEMRQKTWLRVHVIPPLDGIYAQWDFNAGRVKSSTTPRKPRRASPSTAATTRCSATSTTRATALLRRQRHGAFDQGYRSALQVSSAAVQRAVPYHQSDRPGDPTFADANAALGWAQVGGPHGTIVDRIQIDKVTDLTPGGAAQSWPPCPTTATTPASTTAPAPTRGPSFTSASGDEPLTLPTARRASAGGSRGRRPRRVGDRFFQGSIATHGLHLLFLADSDNARQTVPLTEIVSDWRLVMLPGFGTGAEGEQYGRGFEKPLVAVVQ